MTYSFSLQKVDEGRGQPAHTDHINYHCPFGVPRFEAREAPKGAHYILPHSSHINGKRFVLTA